MIALAVSRALAITACTTSSILLESQLNFNTYTIRNYVAQNSNDTYSERVFKARSLLMCLCISAAFLFCFFFL